MKRDRILEVYKITNKINSKVYVGITVQGYKNRWIKHCSDAIRDSSFPLHSAIRKYGIDNFQIEIVEVCKTLEELKDREKCWIKELQSRNFQNGYNVTDGGDGTFGRHHSEETKNKIRQKAIGRKVSEETREVFRNSSTRSKEILMYSISKEYIKTFRSTREASREIKVAATNISKCARGIYKTSGGYIWKYKDENNNV